jgi:DNA-directed RNA polymerase subunit RPC12/RpoP
MRCSRAALERRARRPFRRAEALAYPELVEPVEAAGPTLPHESFGDPECCGTLWGRARQNRPDISDIICNECRAVIRTVATADLQRTLDEMESTLDMASARCPHCGSVNLFPGFSEMVAYVCNECGESVQLSDDPGGDGIFGPEDR